MPHQKTIKQPATIEGVGLHGGKSARVNLCPAAANAGAIFIRTDLPGRPAIKAGLDTLIDSFDSPRRTAVGRGKARVDTIEHIMAALCAFGIDNLRIEIDGPEMPGLDGSALGYVSAIKDAGIVGLNVTRKEWMITGDIEVGSEHPSLRAPHLRGEAISGYMSPEIASSGRIFGPPRNDESGAIIRGFPADGLEISYALDYGDSTIPAQKAEFSLNESNMIPVFEKEIAPSRTFCSEKEAKAALTLGLGKGVNTQNTVVFGKNGVIDNRLRFANECAKHKILDLMGDLFLLGGSVRGRIEAVKSGHAMNYRLIKEIEKMS